MASRPNIVVMMCEDTGRHFGCYGEDYACTPIIDQFAREGTLYSNAFTHAPVCAPSRGGYVTGRYPFSLGNHHMRSTLAHPPRLFTHELRDAGYQVSWATKLDFNLDPTDGWRDTDQRWWEAPPPTEPFFAYVNFGVTHESSMWRSPDDQARATARVRDDQRHDPAGAPVPGYIPDLPEARQMIAAYHDSLTQLDHEAGDVLRWIDQNDLRDNTLVILTADHGRGLLREKRWCYDAGVHLPLIMRWPGQIEPGRINDELVAWVDMAPTFCSLAGAPIPPEYQGQIMLGPDKAPPRQYVYGGRDRMDESYDRTRFARDEQFHYIRNFYPEIPWAQRLSYMEQQSVLQRMRPMFAAGELTGPAAAFMQPTKPPEELYDAQADPEMLNNLADDPAHASQLSRLRAELDRFLDEVQDIAVKSERQLIEEDVLTDRLDEYHQRVQPLPEAQRLGPPTTLVEKHEADAWVQRCRRANEPRR